MAETKVKFPCKPKINMNLHVHSFYDCYNLNDDEKDLWKKKFQNGRYLEIVSRVIFKDHLEIWLS